MQKTPGVGNEEPDTTIVRDLSPSARVFGFEWIDLGVALGMFLPIMIVVGVVFPKFEIPLDPSGFFGFASPNPQKLNLVPWVPGFILWTLLGGGYLFLRQGKTAGFLGDFLEEVGSAVKQMSNEGNSRIWDNLPDLEIDSYELLEDQLEGQEEAAAGVSSINSVNVSQRV